MTKTLPSVPHLHLDIPIIEGIDRRVADIDSGGEGYVEGEAGVGADGEGAEGETGDAELWARGPENEGGDGEGEEGEEGDDAAATRAAARGGEWEEDELRGRRGRGERGVVVGLRGFVGRRRH